MNGIVEVTTSIVKWPKRGNLQSVSKNITRKLKLYTSTTSNLKLPQFPEALSKDSRCFQYLVTMLPKISSEKLKEEMFVGLEIINLMKNEVFLNTMSSTNKQMLRIHLKKS